MDDSIIDFSLRTVEWKDNKVIMIDQTKLPNQLVFVTYDDYNQVADAIRNLVVRGAPAIGVSGAFGLALASLQSKATTKDELISDLEKARKILYDTRPTAIIFWVIRYNAYFLNNLIPSNSLVDNTKIALPTTNKLTPTL